MSVPVIITFKLGEADLAIRPHIDWGRIYNQTEDNRGRVKTITIARY